MTKIRKKFCDFRYEIIFSTSNLYNLLKIHCTKNHSQMDEIKESFIVKLGHVDLIEKLLNYAPLEK